MQSKDRIRVQHILDEANEACKYAEGISFDEFVADGKTVRAVIRSIEVIGEAASKISIEFRKEHEEPKYCGVGVVQKKLQTGAVNFARLSAGRTTQEQHYRTRRHLYGN